MNAVINYGLNELNAGTETAVSGFLIVAGSYYCVKAYSDIRDGKVKSGLTKAVLGAVTLASGVYHFTNTWQAVLEDATVVHCRKWLVPKYMQKCTVFGCEAPYPVPFDGWNQDCLLVRSVGTEGFKNLEDMKKARIIPEFVFLSK